ncbi:MAG: glutamate--tRNA ligase [Acidobacteria bacterium]|nr:glutamate--tRNA ligase [Acidobacteriota bacterium]
MSEVRVRFAPSPTGYLHVGGARTALFNYLFARKHDGTYILRIEDTDRERSSEEHVRGILDGLNWLGLEWDEGPYFQSEGLPRHRENAHRLLQEGKAYRCFCPPELIERKRRLAEEEEGRPWKYDRTCLSLSPDEVQERLAANQPFCIRFLVPPGETTFDDFVHMQTTFHHDEIEDFVLLRSDESPTYQLSVVSDDIEMRVTHVIRGDDHLSNTPKQILLYMALGAEPPVFAHLPLILGRDKKRLSKRHGATSVLAYRDQGLLSPAVVNFLALLGWAPGDDREIMRLDEMIAEFSFEGVGKSGAIFDTDKLLWMSGQHMERTPAHELVHLIEPELAARGVWPPPGGADPAAQRRLETIVDLAKVRRKTLHELASDAVRYLSDDVEIEPEAAAKHLQGDDLRERVLALREAFAAVPNWSAPELEQALRQTAERRGVAASKLIHPARVAVLGVAVSPSLFDVLAVVGRDSVLRRIERLANGV